MGRRSLTEEDDTMFLLSPPSGGAVRRPKRGVVLKEAENELRVMVERT